MPSNPQPGTKLPWDLTSDGLRLMDAFGQLIATVSPKMDFSPGMQSCSQNMAYICHAANSHPQLVARAAELEAYVRDDYDVRFRCETPWPEGCPLCRKLARRAKLLALGGGQ